MPIAHDSRARHACQSRTCCASISFWIVFFGFFLKSTSREAPPACATIAHGRLLRHREDGPPSLHACHARPLRLLYHCCAIQSSCWMRRADALSAFETFDDGVYTDDDRRGKSLFTNETVHGNHFNRSKKKSLFRASLRFNPVLAVSGQQPFLRIAAGLIRINSEVPTRLSCRRMMMTFSCLR